MNKDTMACIQRGRGSIQGVLKWRHPLKPEIITIDVFGVRHTGKDVNYGERYGQRTF